MQLLQILSTKHNLLMEQYKSIVNYEFKRMVDTLGVNLTNVYNTNFYGMFVNTVKRNLLCVTNDNRRDCTYSIDAETLEKNAKAYADNMINVWYEKINSKVGELENVVVDEYDSVGFSITGTKANHNVVIVQHMILNISSKGLLFNQFPSKIYVDGKSLSAAKYTKLFS